MDKNEWVLTRMWTLALCVTVLGAGLSMVRMNRVEVSAAYLGLLTGVIAVGLATSIWGGLLASAAGAFALVLFFRYAGILPRDHTVLNTAGGLVALLLVGPLAGHLSAVVETLHRRAERWLARTEELAAHDEVLGSLKPTWAWVRLEEEIERAVQFRRPLSALLAQVQPDAGTPVENRRERVARLQTLIRMAQAATRPPAVVTHLGDDRILVLLPEHTAAQAASLAHTLQARWAKERYFPDGTGKSLGMPVADCGRLQIGLSSLGGDRLKADAFLAQAQGDERG
jgi:GGDEF domain-containing protein